MELSVFICLVGWYLYGYVQHIAECNRHSQTEEDDGDEHLPRRHVKYKMRSFKHD